MRRREQCVCHSAEYQLHGMNMSMTYYCLHDMLKVLWNPKALLRMCVCVGRERKSVCVLISMTLCPELLIFYVRPVVFCKMLLTGLKWLNMCWICTVYNYIRTSFYNCQWNAIYAPVKSERRVNDVCVNFNEAYRKRQECQERNKDNKEGSVMGFDMNNSPLLFQGTLLSIWEIKRNCMRLQPRVLEEERDYRQKRSLRHQSDANYWGFSHTAPKLQFNSVMIILTWCL